MAFNADRHGDIDLHKGTHDHIELKQTPSYGTGNEMPLSERIKIKYSEVEKMTAEEIHRAQRKLVFKIDLRLLPVLIIMVTDKHTVWTHLTCYSIC